MNAASTNAYHVASDMAAYAVTKPWHRLEGVVAGPM
jgi:hypothetical protein